jgi:hypothetical protein
VQNPEGAKDERESGLNKATDPLKGKALELSKQQEGQV